MRLLTETPHDGPDLQRLMMLLRQHQHLLQEIDRNLKIAADALAPLMDKPYRDVTALAAIALIAVQSARAGIDELKLE